MKRLGSKKLLLLTIFTVSLSFASQAPEEPISKLLTIARFAGPLTDEQKEEFRKRLDDIADARGNVEPQVARVIQEAMLEQAGSPLQAGPVAGEMEEKGEAEVKESKAEQVSKQVDKPGQAQGNKKKGELEHIFRSKKAELKKGSPMPIPADVLKHIGSFLPADYVIPQEWNVKFTPKQTIQEFTRVRLDTYTSDPQYDMAVSADGRFMGITHDTSIEIWDMQSSSREPMRTLHVDNINPQYGIERIALGTQGLVGYVGLNNKGKTIVGVMNIKNGKMLWIKTIDWVGMGFSHSISFSPDGAFLAFSFIERNNSGEESFGPRLIWEAKTGKELEGLDDVPLTTNFANFGLYRNQPLYSGLQVGPQSFSFDGTKAVLCKNRELTQCVVEQLGQPQAACSMPFGRFEEDRTSISPEGKRVGVIRYMPKKFPQDVPSYYVVSVWDGQRCSQLKELDRFEKGTFNARVRAARNRTDTVSLSTIEHKVPVGIAFSPAGRYLMWALYDQQLHQIIIKICDLDEEIGNVDEPWSTY